MGVGEVVPASAADHAAVNFFLTSVLPRSSADRWLAWGEDPLFEPPDRLLVKAGERLVGHVTTLKRMMRFAGRQWPVGQLVGLCTMPDYRRMGIGRKLVAAAEKTMRKDGAVLGLLSTRIPHYFRSLGWVPVGRHRPHVTQASRLLARLSELNGRFTERRVEIRPWRQVNLSPLLRLYGMATSSTSGPFERSENHWRWLVRGKGFDQILVAHDCRRASRPILGYMVAGDEGVVELAVEPGRADVARELLGRAASDCMESNQLALRFFAPAGSPLGELFDKGRGATDDGGDEWVMAKVLDLEAMLSRIRPVVLDRVRRLPAVRCPELGLLVDGKRYCLSISRRAVKLSADRVGRSFLTLGLDQLTQVLLGQWRPGQTSGVEASTRLAGEAAAELFPRTFLWHPPLDYVLI
jgi:GNAT superfamily N-acetyltransferase